MNEWKNSWMIFTKEIQESLLAGKAKVGNNNDDTDKKHEERNTIK
jgi:hypothetical protein